MVLIMNRKKVFLILVSLVMVSLFSNVVFASSHTGGGLGEGLGGVAETIRELFGFIPDVLTLDKLIAGGEAGATALFWAKFLIWLLLFSALYFGASKVFADNKRIAVVVALAIAFMGALLIPNDVVIDIFKTYGLAAGFVVWFLPVLVGLFIAHKIGNPVVKTVFYLVLILLLINIDNSLTAPGSWLEGNNWIDYFRLLFAVVIIAFIWNLFSMFGGGGGVSGAIGDRVGRMGDSFSDWISGDSGRRDRDRRGRGRDEKEEEEIEEEEEKALGQTKRERELIAKIIDVDVKDLDTDVKLKQYLEKVRSFVHQYLARKMSRAGWRSFDQFRRRIHVLIPEIEKVLGIIQNREERDKKVNEMITYNERLLGRILGILRRIEARVAAGGAAAATRAEKDRVLNVLRGKFRAQRHVPIRDDLVDATRRAERITKIEEHLNEVIKRSHLERTTLLKKIEEKLNKILFELNKELPRVPRGYATTRGPFLEVIKLLDEVIKQMQEVIDIDTYTLKREKQMYEEDKFLLVITSKDPV